MKTLLKLPTLLLGVLSIGSVVGVAAQDATPSSRLESWGTPVEALECWATSPILTAGYPQFPGVPEMLIDTTSAYYAEIVTNRGTIGTALCRCGSGDREQLHLPGNQQLLRWCDFPPRHARFHDPDR